MFVDSAQESGNSKAPPTTETVVSSKIGIDLDDICSDLNTLD